MKRGFSVWFRPPGGTSDGRDLGGNSLVPSPQGVLGRVAQQQGVALSPPQLSKRHLFPNPCLPLPLQQLYELALGRPHLWLCVWNRLCCLPLLKMAQRFPSWSSPFFPSFDLSFLGTYCL